jgi:hypothetical protein
MLELQKQKIYSRLGSLDKQRPLAGKEESHTPNSGSGVLKAKPTNKMTLFTPLGIEMIKKQEN